MLNKDEMIRIALDECVAMLGENLINSHKDLCCGAYSTTQDGLFSYVLGVDTEKTQYSIGNETPMKYYASVIIDPTTEKITRDYKKSILPA